MQRIRKLVALALGAAVLAVGGIAIPKLATGDQGGTTRASHYQGWGGRTGSGV